MSAASMMKVFPSDFPSPLPSSWESIKRLPLQPFFEQVLEADLEPPQVLSKIFMMGFKLRQLFGTDRILLAIPLICFFPAQDQVSSTNAPCQTSNLPLLFLLRCLKS
jgi:hypothetical protein